METLTPLFEQHLERIEPVIAFAYERLSSIRPEEVADPAEPMAEARRAVRAAADYVSLYAPQEYVRYNPAALFRKARAPHADPQHPVDIEPTRDGVGLPQGVLACLQSLGQCAVLEDDSAFITEVFEEDDIPHAALTLDGPGRIPDAVPIGGFISVPLEEFAERWTFVTRGGRLDRSASGLLLRLAGVRLPPEPVAELAPFRDQLEAANDTLSDVQQGQRSREQALDAVNAVLDAVDAFDAPLEPGNIDALIEGVAREHAADPLRESFILETWCLPDIPPVLMRRNRMLGFFRNALRAAAVLLPESATVNIIADYNQSARNVEILISFRGGSVDLRRAFHLASMRRAICETHDGTFDVTPEDNGAAVLATLPDTVGRKLDRWIPGFEAFSAQSRQVLRLLKSGGQTPPDEVLLPAVLEHELQRWLMPALEGPAAVSVAHELPEENPGLPGASAPRLKKALQQIRRGKPRKELAAPEYAAEILWACRTDARHREAVGAGVFSTAELEAFCVALMRHLPEYRTCLQAVARALKSRQ